MKPVLKAQLLGALIGGGALVQVALICSAVCLALEPLHPADWDLSAVMSTGLTLGVMGAIAGGVIGKMGAEARLFARSVAREATEANCRRVRPGMTEGELAALFGAPPLWTVPRSRTPGEVSYWMGVAGDAVVEFGPDGRVQEVQFDTGPPPRPRLLRPGSWLGW
jgi:hypothetical protein